MCDYSLHAYQSRDAVAGETIEMLGTFHGFATPAAPLIAVCLRPGTELMVEGVGYRLGENDARKICGVGQFAKLNPQQENVYHDAIVFGDETVYVAHLCHGTTAKVLQLPATTMTAAAPPKIVREVSHVLDAVPYISAMPRQTPRTMPEMAIMAASWTGR